MNWNDPLPAECPAPLWFQIAERLRAAIKRRKFKLGDALPSESQINETFGVSRATSRAALGRLEQEGLIQRRSGKGSIVIESRVDQPVTEMLGFAEDMRRRGLRPEYETRFVGNMRVHAEVANALEIKLKAPVFQSRRLLKADGAPIGFAESWLAPWLFRDIDPPTADDLGKGSLYEWLTRECNVRLTGGREFIEAALVSEEMARELQIPALSAVLIVRRLSRDSKGRPVEYAVLHFRPDRYRFQLVVKN